MPKPARRHSPEGCNRPVLMYLTADEGAWLKQKANAEHRSMSATARMIVVRDMEQAQNAPSPANPSIQ